MDEIIVSVVVPAYNAEQYITEAIESILAQTFRSFEIIVVDDGSTDGTARLAKKFGKDVRYIYQRNRGLAAARNTGIRNSQADLIALLDADDLWEPGFLEAMVKLLDQCPEAASAYCGFQYIDEQGHPVGTPSLEVLPPEKFHERLIREGNWLSACAVVFRRQLAEAIGLFDESLRAVEDEDLWIRLSERWSFVGLAEALVKYRRHDSNMSRSPERMVTAILQVRAKLLGPPDGDAETWSVTKREAYRNAYQMAAIRYLAAGQLPMCATFIEQLAQLSSDFVCSLALWRGLARAHMPEVYQFDPTAQLDLAAAETHVLTVLDELASRMPLSIGSRRQSVRMKGSACLALADETGRAGKLERTFYWLWKSASVHPRILFARPYWGTLARSFLFRLQTSRRPAVRNEP